MYNKIISYLSFLVFSLFSLSAFSKNLPMEMRYKDKPIDPYVIQFAMDKDVDLRDTNKLKHNIAIDPTIKDLSIVGVECKNCQGYYFKDSKFPTDRPAFAFYKYLGDYDKNSPLILYYHSNGGTAINSSIIVLERRFDTIRAKKVLFSGDRAEALIKNADITTNLLKLSAYINAYKLYEELGKLHQFKHRISTELPSAPNSPLVVANYEINFHNHKDEMTLKSINFIEDQDKWGFLSLTNPLEIKLHSLLNHEKEAGATLLTEKQLKNLAERMDEEEEFKKTS